jgi:hypothetical protein
MTYQPSPDQAHTELREFYKHILADAFVAGTSALSNKLDTVSAALVDTKAKLAEAPDYELRIKGATTAAAKTISNEVADVELDDLGTLRNIVKQVRRELLERTSADDPKTIRQSVDDIMALTREQLTCFAAVDGTATALAKLEANSRALDEARAELDGTKQLLEHFLGRMPPVLSGPPESIPEQISSVRARLGIVGEEVNSALAQISALDPPRFSGAVVEAMAADFRRSDSPVVAALSTAIDGVTNRADSRFANVDSSVGAVKKELREVKAALDGLVGGFALAIAEVQESLREIRKTDEGQHTELVDLKTSTGSTSDSMSTKLNEISTAVQILKKSVDMQDTKVNMLQERLDAVGSRADESRLLLWTILLSFGIAFVTFAVSSATS